VARTRSTPMATPLRRLQSRVRSKVRGYPDLVALTDRGLELGRDVYVGQGAMIDPWQCWLITIGDEAVLSARVVVLAHDATTRRGLGYTRIAPVTIGARAFIGAGAHVLLGVTIGEDAIVGAGSVVRRNIPVGAVAVGNPAAIVGSVDQYLDRQRAAMEGRPRYPRQGWTVPGGITAENRARMRADLLDGVGFVE
jgi:maltose O-acetyltransferase